MAIEPLVLVLTLSTIFWMLGRAGPDGHPFPLFFYAGLLPWNFFRTSLTSGTLCFVKDRAIITKINYPRELSVFKSIAIVAIEFCFASIAFAVLLAFYAYPPNMNWFFLPVVMLILVALCTGMIFITASLHVFLRDIGILTKIVASILFWFTPIIFVFPFIEPTKILYFVNPMVGIITAMREIILYDSAPELHHLVTPLAFSIVFLIFGIAIFKRLNKRFVDVL